MLQLRLVRNEDEFIGLRSDWNRLLVDSNLPSIFLTWEWLYNWWCFYKRDRELYILCVYLDREIRAIFPLLRRRALLYGLFPYVVVEFLGTGEIEEDEVCSLYMDFIISKGAETEAIQAFVKNIRADKTWDELRLKTVRKDSFAERFLMDYVADLREFSVSETEFRSAYSVLERGWDEFLSSLGGRTRKKIRKGIRILEGMKEKTTVSFEYLEDDSQIEEMYEAFVNLSLRRWRGGGAFSSRIFREFQRTICREFLKNGWLSLSFLRIGDQLVAANLDYKFLDRVYGYQTAFDPEFLEVPSVGIMGMVLAIQKVMNDGYKLYDWCGARPGSYKMHFADNYVECANALVRRSNLRGFLLSCSDKLLNFVRGGRRWRH